MDQAQRGPARTSWRLAEGEEARLTPDGAVIESRGRLPLRVRTEGQSYLRPAFPGTAVRLAAERYEVIGEEQAGDVVTYHLQPWPADHVERDSIVYEPRLIRAVLAERRGAAERHRARTWGWLLYPIVGLLPEAGQLRACDRYGLHPAMATLISGALELVAVVAFGQKLFSGLDVRNVLAIPLLASLAIPAAHRLVFALAFREVAGWWVLVLAERWTSGAGSRPRQLDASVLPLTREAFWARLAQADRHEREEGGTVLCTSTLPHLTWGGTRRLQSPSGDWWMAAALPPFLERGRLFHRYRLTPLLDPHDETGRVPEAPSPRAYQDEVAEQVAREWDDLLIAGAWFVSILPAEVQQRAFGPRGGPALAAPKARLTAVLEIVVGFFMIAAGLFWLGLTPMDVFSVGFLVEGGMRFARASRPEYAPSVLGLAFADLLRPERLAYRAHLEAERDALASLAS